MSEGSDQGRYTGWANAITIACRQDAGKMEGLRGLRACRERRHLTQKQVADRIGVSHPTYMRWERCNGWPYAYYLPRLAQALKVGIDELYLGPRDAEEGAT